MNDFETQLTHFLDEIFHPNFVQASTNFLTLAIRLKHSHLWYSVNFFFVYPLNSTT